MLFVLKSVCGKYLIESLLILIICSFFEYVVLFMLIYCSLFYCIIFQIRSKDRLLSSDYAVVIIKSLQ